MNPLWKQNNPADQVVVILMAIEGHISNVKDGITGIQKFVDYTEKLTSQLKEIEPYLRGEKEWSECESPKRT